MESRDRSELQLLRISQGANELAHMIHSWPKFQTVEGESAHMASELLRGSLELQNSLQFLSMLQGASSRKSSKNMRKTAKEKDEGEILWEGTSSKRASVDGCSTNSMEELKQVVRYRLCMQRHLSPRSDDEKASLDKALKFTDRKNNFSPQVKKMKAPNLIGRLMGLEEFPLGGNRPGPLRANIEEDDEVPPIVIKKSMNLPTWEGEKLGPVAGMRSECEKITLAESFLEDKSFVYGSLMSFNSLKHNEVKRNVKCGIDQHMQQQEQKSIMDSKRTGEQKRQGILGHGKRIVELDEVKAMGAPVNKVLIRSAKPDKGKITEKVRLQTYISMKNSKKEICLARSASLKSNCFLKREKISKEMPVRRFTREAKVDDKKFKDGKLSSSTETPAISRRSRSIPATNILPKQEKKNKTTFLNKDGIRKDHKIISEATMPINQALRNTSSIEQSNKGSDNMKHQLLCSQNLDMQPQAKNDQLLLDHAKELMACKSHEGKLPTNRMLQIHVKRRSMSLSFSRLHDEISNSMKNLAGYSEIGEEISTENSLYSILDNDLRCAGTRSNSAWDDGWNDSFSAREADQIVIEVEEQIISRILIEVAMDLAALVYSDFHACFM